MPRYQHLDFEIDAARDGIAYPSWSKKSFPYPHHRLYCPYSGEAEMILNDDSHTLRPGKLYLIPAFSMVETICRDHFSHHYLHFQLNMTGIHDIFGMYNVPFSLKADANTIGHFQDIYKHYEVQSPYDIMMTFKAFYSLIGPFFKDCGQLSPDVIRLEPVLNYIDYNLESKISNSDLAAILHLDTVYFANLFSRIIGQSPNQYLIKKRLERSQTFLATTDMKIKDIAAKCGFENHMYFTTQFRKKLNMTPSAYRRLHKKVHKP